MSGKTSTQPGRRTPLSLSGTVTKPHQTKSGNTANGGGGGSNANGHTTSNTNKQDNKLQLQKTEIQHTANFSETKDNPNKKQQLQADKKQQLHDNNKKSSDKNQNGVNNNKQQQSNENKQEHNTKEKQQQQQQNGNDNKFTEKERKEKSEKSDKLEKQEYKPEKEEAKVKDDKKQEQEKLDNKKEEKKHKEMQDVKEDKKEAVAKNDERVGQHQQQVKKDDKKSKEEIQSKNAEPENMKVAEEQQQQQQSQHKSSPVTPKKNSKTAKTLAPVNKTPIKANEKTVKSPLVTKREVTTAVYDNEDIEMEPLAMDSSPIKSSQSEEVTHVNIAPSATSTPGKILLPKRNTAVPKSDVKLAMQAGISPERPRAFSQISGRKSIRPISDYTPSKFQSNLQFRESYRRINTELDVTNTSMNVTVGSEVPNNLSFSFFGRGRKRDHTNPQNSESAIGELHTDLEISPPKRARLDMHGFFSVVSSPISLLRSRFSKTTLQNSPPVKLQQKLNADEDEIEVQNVSGVSVHEDISKTDKEPIETNNSTNDDNDTSLGEEVKESILKNVTPSESATESKAFTDVSLKCEKSCGMKQTSEESDIKITETSFQAAVGDPMAKNKRCIIM